MIAARAESAARAPSMPGRLRLVLDTNVWLDWLIFHDPGVAAIRAALAANRVEICIDAACEGELARVLAYDLGRRTLDAAAQKACLAECRRIARRIEAAAPDAERAQLPRCRDPDDQIFLEAALAAGAQILVTKDRALLELAARGTRSRWHATPFRILAPAEFPG